MPVGTNVELARGHGSRLPTGRRIRITGDNPTHAIAPAIGFVSTAADLVRFFAQLDPARKGGSSCALAGERWFVVRGATRMRQSSVIMDWAPRAV